MGWKFNLFTVLSLLAGLFLIFTEYVFIPLSNQPAMYALLVVSAFAIICLILSCFLSKPMRLRTAAGSAVALVLSGAVFMLKVIPVTPSDDDTFEASIYTIVTVMFLAAFSLSSYLKSRTLSTQGVAP